MTALDASRDIAQAVDLRLVNIRKVCELTSLSRATIYRLVYIGKFPKPIRISRNRVAWRERAVLLWLAAPAEADK
jgi:prophage regulatory protein